MSATNNGKKKAIKRSAPESAGKVRDVSNFRVAVPAKHALHRLELYVGSKNRQSVKIYGYYIDDKHNNSSVKLIDSTLPTAVKQIFAEAMINAADAVRERGKNVAMPTTYVTVTKERVSIKNGGTVVPVEKDSSGEYIIRKLFGELYSSFNYNEDINTTNYNEEINVNETLGGFNGVGSKLPNIASKEFEVEVADGKLCYTQKWRNNMSEYDPPTTRPSKEKYVQISYVLDFQRFENTQLYTEDDIAIFAFRCLTFSFTSKMPIMFNNHLIESQTVASFTKIIFGDSLFVYSPQFGLWNHKQDDKKKVKLEYNKPKERKGELPTMEFAIVDMPPNDAGLLSFVNGIWTPDGGPHVNSIYESMRYIIDGLNKDRNSVSKKQLTISSIKKNATVVVSVNVRGKPDLEGNIKSKLSSPEFNFILNDEQKKNISSFHLITALENELYLHKAEKLKNDAIIDNRHSISKFTPAFSEKIKGRKRILILAEGDSAFNYAMRYKSMHERKDDIGILSFRGKPINVITCSSVESLLNNREYIAFSNALGLNPLGEELTKEPDVDSKLIYHQIWIAADQDDDGAHIAGLIVLMTQTQFPGFIAQNRLYLLHTPIMSVESKTGKKREIFFHPVEFKQWVDENPNYTSSWRTKYYKGLGSISPETAIIDAGKLRHILLQDQNSEHTKNALDLAFRKANSDARKQWITNHDITRIPPIVNQMTIDQFVNDHVIRHAVASLLRTIPKMDGLKIGQRKIMSAAMNKWKKFENIDLIRTASLVGHVMEVMAYHHGDTSLADTINRMASRYMNNLPLLVPDGEFETRYGNRASAPRYTSVGPYSWWEYMFPAIDRQIVPRNNDDGVDVEWQYIPQVLPLICINGAKSIGTGWSSEILGANPIDVARYFKEKLSGVETPRIFRPWFYNFKGSINIVKRSKLGAIFKDLQKCIKEGKDMADVYQKEEYLGSSVAANIADLPDYDFDCVVITGKFQVDKGIVTITQLPVGVKYKSYKKWLIQLKDKGLIHDFVDNCTLDDPEFIIYGFPDPNVITLGLRKVYPQSNMILLDDNDKPIKFNSMRELADAWYTWRIAQYANRKQYMLDEYKAKISTLQTKRTFVDLVVSGKLIINGRKKEDIKKDLDNYDIPYKLVKNTTLHSCTYELINKINREVEDINNKYDILQNKSIEDIWTAEIEAVEPGLKKIVTYVPESSKKSRKPKK